MSQLIFWTPDTRGVITVALPWPIDMVNEQVKQSLTIMIPLLPMLTIKAVGMTLNLDKTLSWTANQQAYPKPLHDA